MTLDHWRKKIEVVNRKIEWQKAIGRSIDKSQAKPQGCDEHGARMLQ